LLPLPEVIMPQAPGVSDVIARRTDAVLAAFRGVAEAGGLSCSTETDVKDHVRLGLATDQIGDLSPVDIDEPT
jgi:hypothetical protein